jgi:SCF-associated factor 1
VTVPTEVRFDHEGKRDKEMFCFAATAAGWHMGALVIDLEVGDRSDSFYGGIYIMYYLDDCR